MIYKTLATFILSSSFFVTAFAGPFTDNLSRCLVVSTDQSDRNTLANWVFRVMAEHPNIKRKIGDVYPEIQKIRADLDVAEIFTKLLIERCPTEAKEALLYEEEIAFQTAFEVLGKVAMQELMSDPAVAGEVEKFTKYIDMEAWTRAFE